MSDNFFSSSASTSGVDSFSIDPSTSDYDGATETSCSTDDATSFISTLKSPTQSNLCRKRKIFTNPVRSNFSKRTNRSKPHCSTDPKSIKPSQRVKEFDNEHLKVSAGKLFCSACREELSSKKSIVKNHVSSVKHSTGKERLQKSEKKTLDIVDAFKTYDAEVHPSGETLPENVRVYRVKVLSTFLKAGVPLNKLPLFREILEENGQRLASRKPMADLIPFVLQEEKQCLHSEITGKYISAIFDGTTRLGEALAVIVRFVEPEKFFVTQRLIYPIANCD